MSRPVSLRVFVVFGVALLALAVAGLSRGDQQKSVAGHGALVDFKAIHIEEKIVLFRAFEDGFVERADVTARVGRLTGQWGPPAGPVPAPSTRPEREVR